MTNAYRFMSNPEATMEQPSALVGAVSVVFIGVVS